MRFNHFERPMTPHIAKMKKKKVKPNSTPRRKQESKINIHASSSPRCIASPKNKLFVWHSVQPIVSKVGWMFGSQPDNVGCTSCVSYQRLSHIQSMHQRSFQDRYTRYVEDHASVRYIFLSGTFHGNDGANWRGSPVSDQE